MFLNLKNNKLSINTYRFVDAVSTTVEDILDCVDTKQTLTAMISTEEEWRELKFLSNKTA